MKLPPFVSIIMPAYNCAEYVPEAIHSILNQTYTHWELIICDDASTDNTKEIIEHYLTKDHRITTSHNRINQRLLKTRNRLLSLCKGDLITFQDADDFSDVRRLELMVAEFQRNLKLGLLASQVAYIDRNGKRLRTSAKPLSYEEVQKSILKENVVGGSIMMIRKDALQAVGGKFRDFFDGLSYQDYDLSLLIAEKYEAYSLPEVLYYYRQHGKSTSKMVSVDRLLAKEIVLYLARQRRMYGKDDLMEGKPESVKEYFNRLRTPYLVDPSRVFREYSENYMYNRLFMKAIQTSWQAVKVNPLYFLNWRTFQYCLRKSILKTLFTIVD